MLPLCEVLLNFFIPTAQSILDKGNFSFHLRVINHQHQKLHKQGTPQQNIRTNPRIGRWEDLQEALNSLIRLRPMFYLFL